MTTTAGVQADVLKRLVDGEEFVWLGEPYRLELVDDAGSDPIALDFSARRLRLRRDHATRETVIDWYRARGREHAAELVEFWTTRASVPERPVEVTDLGSHALDDDRRGTIRLHWAAFQLPAPALEYLVVFALLDAASSRAPGRTLLQLLDQHLLGWRVHQAVVNDERPTVWRGAVDGTLVPPIPGITQPMPEPKLISEYLDLVRAGRLIDHAGRPLTLHDCMWCGGYLVSGEVCPVMLRCPLSTCGAAAGARRCRRPSGHEASELHAPRIRAAEQLVEARLAAGDTYVPAPWPGPRRPLVGEQEALFGVVSQCGTGLGYQRHLDADEAPCSDCQTALADLVEAGFAVERSEPG